MKKWLIITVVVLLLIGLTCTQVTFFIVQPIGAVPEGRTMLIFRLNEGKFIDSADAMCERIQGSVNLICRATAIGAVANNATIIARLPYSRTLYLISTDGSEYTSPESSDESR